MTSTKHLDTAAPKRIRAWYRAAVKRLRAHGYRISAGSWFQAAPRWGAGGACVFSYETCGPATYGHPRATLHLIVGAIVYRPEGGAA